MTARNRTRRAARSRPLPPFAPSPLPSPQQQQQQQPGSSGRKRWPRGQSCLTNPASHRFRVQARLGQSRAPAAVAAPAAPAAVPLTEQQLRLHETRMDDDDDGGENAEHAALTPSAPRATADDGDPFHSLRQLRHSQALVHREKCAVLAAVEEVIREQSGSSEVKLTPAVYFAALVTALENQLASEAPSEAEAAAPETASGALAATAQLLLLVLPAVDVTVLRNRFSHTSNVLMATLQHCQAAETAAVGTASAARAAAGSLALLLRAQELAVWQQPHTLRVFNHLLALAGDPRPKVRRTAQDGIYAILGAAREHDWAGASHPAAAGVVHHCMERIRQCNTTDPRPALHAMGLLKRVLPLLTATGIHSIALALVKLLELHDAIVTQTLLEVLEALLAADPGSSLSADTCESLIHALARHRPNDADGSAIRAWAAVMVQLHVFLARHRVRACVARLPAAARSLLQLLESSRANVIAATAQCLDDLVVGTMSADGAAMVLAESCAHDGGTPMHEFVDAMQTVLKYRYQSAWPTVLPALASLIRHAGPHAAPLLRPLLLALAALRDRATEQGSAHVAAAVDACLGEAVRAMEPKRVLAVLPLLLSVPQLPLAPDAPVQAQFPRAWLLPLLRDHTQNTRLAYFVRHLLPLAEAMGALVRDLHEQRRSVEAKAYEQLEAQLWSTLPGFCTVPTDVPESFGQIAKACAPRPDGAAGAFGAHGLCASRSLTRRRCGCVRCIVGSRRAAGRPAGFALDHPGRTLCTHTQDTTRRGPDRGR